MTIELQRGRISRDSNTAFFTSQGVGAGTFFLHGGCEFSAADANLTQASTTVTIGSANTASGGHAILVAAGAGSVNAGSCSIVVSGTSINDQGVRQAADSQTIVSDITTMSTDEYFETTKKWIGQVTYTLTPNGAATYNADFNYGLIKYDDLGNRDFKITNFEAVGLAGGNDTSFNITLYHHNSTSWTYSAAAFSPTGVVICDMNADYVTEKNLANGELFAYKRDNLNTNVNGADSEGFFVKVVTGAANAVEHMTTQVGVDIIV